MRNQFVAARAILILSTLFLFSISESFALNEVELIENYNTYPRNGYNSEHAVLNGILIISRRDEEHGDELWKIDSPGATPTLLKDIQPGEVSSSPRQFTLALGKLFFTAFTEANGTELWVTDGTEAGTNLVADIYAGSTSSNPREITSFASDTRIAFAATGLFSGNELCISDGTEAGSSCYDIHLGTDSSSPGEITRVGNSIVFVADNGTIGREPWVLDQSLAFPSIIRDINPGPGSSNPREITEARSGVIPFALFSANDGTNGTEPWLSLGTTPTTNLLKNIGPGSDSSNPGNFTQLNGSSVIFTASVSGQGKELWITDATDVGTTLVKDIYPGNRGSSIFDISIFNGKAYFAAEDPTNGRELWTSDGTTVGTQLLKDIEPGEEGSSPDDFFIFNGKLHFSADTTDQGFEPYYTDGTSAGTKILEDLFPGNADGGGYDLGILDNQLYFFGADNNGPSVFFTNVTGTSVDITTPLPGIGDEGSGPGSTTAINNTYLFMTMSQQAFGHEPHSYNVNTGQITMLGDIYPGQDDSDPGVIGVLNNKLIFAARSETLGRELWITDGTVSGTMLLKDIEPGERGSEPRDISLDTPYKGELYFSASTDTEGRELWKTDGTAAGTVIVKDIDPGNGSSDPRFGTIALNNQLFFVAEDNGNDREIWKTDGNATSTEQVTNISPGFDARPFDLYEHDGYLFFAAETAAFGDELYKTDGTTLGTGLVSDIRAGNSSSSPRNFFSIGDILVFTAKTIDGPVIMRVTAPYTDLQVTQIADTDPTSTTGNVSEFVNVFGTVLFSAPTPGENSELWSTDGTAGGTSLFKTVRPGTGTSSIGIDDMTQAGDYFYFPAEDGATGRELWRTDGRSLNTELFTDIYVGEDGSRPDWFLNHRGTLYFSARDKGIGTEFWRLVYDECPDDPSKLEFGACGCGTPDIDSDGDGTFDCSDSCAADALKTTAGSCGCGQVDEDLDASGVADCLTTEEIKVRSDLLSTLLTEFKRKPKKGRKLRLRAIFQAYKELNRYSRTQLSAFVNSTEKKTKKRLKNLRRKIKKFRQKATNKNRRKSIKALARFLAIAP